VKAQFKMADREGGARTASSSGENELATNSVVLKDLKTTEQHDCPTRSDRFATQVVTNPSQHLEYAPTTPCKAAPRGTAVGAAGGSRAVDRSGPSRSHRGSSVTRRRFIPAAVSDVRRAREQRSYSKRTCGGEEAHRRPRYATDSSGAIAYLVPAEWTSFYASLGSGFQTSGTVFLHEARFAEWTRVLVGVDVNLFSTELRRADGRNDGRTHPGTGLRLPRPAHEHDRDPRRRRPGPVDPATGPPDDLRGPSPTPPTRRTSRSITILNGVRHTLDGWLVDANEIKIESRD
jgi:hypothetical protein